MFPDTIVFIYRRGSPLCLRRILSCYCVGLAHRPKPLAVASGWSIIFVRVRSCAILRINICINLSKPEGSDSLTQRLDITIVVWHWQSSEPLQYLFGDIIVALYRSHLSDDTSNVGNFGCFRTVDSLPRSQHDDYLQLTVSRYCCR